MKTLLELAYNKHKDWINIVKSFGCNPSYAEDVVMEMYMQLDKDIKRGLDLFYKEDINYYYCYKVLRGIYFNIYKKESKQIKIYLEDMNNEIQQAENLGIDEVEYAKQKKAVDDILDEMYWYNRKVFEIVASGKSVAALSRETGISYHSLYNTYITTKRLIKNKL